jgi:hypothetical protein
MLGHEERGAAELFITGSLRQLIPAGRSMTCWTYRDSETKSPMMMAGPALIPRWR